MELTAASLWEWTKLTVRAPGTAARLVKEAALPLNTSVLMIVLAGVMSGVASGLLEFLIGSAPMTFQLEDGRTVTFEQGGPISQGIYAVLSGLALGYFVYLVGRRMGGQGSLSDIMGVVAVLQLVMTVILVGQTLAILLSPLLALTVLLFGLYVFFRGLGHGVNVGHGFDDLGKSALVIVLAIFCMALAAFVVVAVFGIGPAGEINEL